LHGRDLMLAQGLAHNVEATRQRRIAEMTVLLRWDPWPGLFRPVISPD
jgi:hypothetical protein